MTQVRINSQDLAARPIELSGYVVTPVARVSSKSLRVGPLALFAARARPSHLEITAPDGASRTVRLRDLDAQVRLAIRATAVLAILILRRRQR